jgi:ribose transport system substrate-binding protein
VDAVISILGDSAVEPKFKALRDAGIPVFTVDHVSQYSVNNTTSDNYTWARPSAATWRMN